MRTQMEKLLPLMHYTRRWRWGLKHINGKMSLHHPIPCTDKLGQMPIIYSEDMYCLSPQCLKKFVLKSHLKAPNMQQLKKKKKEIKQMKLTPQH